MSATMGLLHATKKLEATATQHPLCLPFINTTASNRQDKICTNRMLKKTLHAGCSKTLRYKASEIPRSETYIPVRRNDEGRGQRRRWAFFSKLLFFYNFLEL